MTAAALAAFAALAACPAAAAAKPNILVLLADDHSAEAVGFRPRARLRPLVRALNATKHIDQLASDGVWVEDA